MGQGATIMVKRHFADPRSPRCNCTGAWVSCRRHLCRRHRVTISAPVNEFPVAQTNSLFRSEQGKRLQALPQLSLPSAGWLPSATRVAGPFWLLGRVVLIYALARTVLIFATARWQQNSARWLYSALVVLDVALEASALLPP